MELATSASIAAVPAAAVKPKGGNPAGFLPSRRRQSGPPAHASRASVRCERLRRQRLRCAPAKRRLNLLSGTRILATFIHGGRMKVPSALAEEQPTGTDTNFVVADAVSTTKPAAMVVAVPNHEKNSSKTER